MNVKCFVLCASMLRVLLIFIITMESYYMWKMEGYFLQNKIIIKVIKILQVCVIFGICKQISCGCHSRNFWRLLALKLAWLQQCDVIKILFWKVFEGKCLSMRVTFNYLSFFSNVKVLFLCINYQSNAGQTWHDTQNKWVGALPISHGNNVSFPTYVVYCFLPKVQ